MKLEDKSLLHDIQIAAQRIKTFTHGIDYSGYQADDMLRAAVERQFEIIGEALNRLAQGNSQLAGHITGYQRIIAFRNNLIHGYAQVDNRLVWSVVEDKLPALLDEVIQLLDC